ncbi:MAG TPA: hypothetical protein PKV48_07215 [Thermodesulfobacteriota bacterium]|nr:hypothetical protein [Thermodesulfobacteriota bacterium]
MVRVQLWLLQPCLQVENLKKISRFWNDVEETDELTVLVFRYLVHEEYVVPLSHNPEDCQ